MMTGLAFACYLLLANAKAQHASQCTRLCMLTGSARECKVHANAYHNDQAWQQRRTKSWTRATKGWSTVVLAEGVGVGRAVTTEAV